MELRVVHNIGKMVSDETIDLSPHPLAKWNLNIQSELEKLKENKSVSKVQPVEQHCAVERIEKMILQAELSRVPSFSTKDTTDTYIQELPTSTNTSNVSPTNSEEDTTEKITNLEDWNSAKVKGRSSRENFMFGSSSESQKSN